MNAKVSKQTRRTNMKKLTRRKRQAWLKAGEGGRCRVIVGDFREDGHLVLDASVDLVFTDPPYARESAVRLKSK
jgi:16S rRNA G966 N2-methylase RsmD